jgi:hypothetical protein
VAAAELLAEDEYDGDTLVHVKPKTLARLLKGSGAEGAVPALLAARDAHMAWEAAVVVAVALDVKVILKPPCIFH